MTVDPTAAPVPTPVAATPLRPPTDTLHIVAWPDPIIERFGYDPRSTYVEKFWLGVLGPSTVWFLRRVADGFETSPQGFDLSLADTARSIGLGGEGRNSPFVRTLSRCCQFELAQPQGEGTLAVRRKLPPLALRQLRRLPEALQDEHRLWQVANAHRSDDGALEQLERRARQLARTLADLGEDLPSIERQLLRWRFHPSLAGEAAAWAWEQHHGGQLGQPPLPAA